MAIGGKRIEGAKGRFRFLLGDVVLNMTGDQFAALQATSGTHDRHESRLVYLTSGPRSRSAIRKG